MLFDADVFAAVAVVVVNDRSTYELRAGEDGNKERGALLSFLSSCFFFLLRRRASPPRPRTNAEKRLGTEDYSLKGKAKAFFKLDQ